MSTVIAKNVQVGADGTASNNFTVYQPATPDGTLRIGNGNSGTTSSLVTLTSAGAATVASLTVPGATALSTLSVNSNNISAVNSLGFRNRIINGDMRIDQRNAGASVSMASNAYPVDRWVAFEDTDGAMTAQRSTVAPEGFTNSVVITTTTADASLGASQYARFFQSIEGFNVADLGWGTANAKTVTLSFWVRSSLTGTFGGSVYNSAFNRSYPFSYTISAANTWEQKTVTIAGDNSGTWLTDNGIGLGVNFGLGTGSTFSGTAGAWTGSGFLSATGATSVVGTNGATFYITGVQLEAGSVATPFERRDYGRELIMCQRYFEVLQYQSNSYSMFSTPLDGFYNNWAEWFFSVQKRAAPTIGLVTGTWTNTPTTIIANATGAMFARGTYFYTSGTSGNPGLFASAEL